MSRVVDTSVLYALFDEADAHHERARRDLAAQPRWAVPLAVLVEFLLVVRRRHGKPVAQRAMQDLQGMGRLDIVQPQDAAKVLALWRDHPTLSAPDAVGLQEALHTGVPLLTYDQGQASVYRDLAR